ncbi:peptide deformylase 1B, chloroplastic-like [Triticum urartu]|uniref:Peptide deformylase n=2 Tax=Triticum TaxID=4564 RepID=A0A8R7PTX2_TRIUA|nr:peptide deformylase 1B, chloroplastic-like [Triticum urartu]VAH61982.1 unnamed protein product [Triticum turgidum subsp. durum]
MQLISTFVDPIIVLFIFSICVLLKKEDFTNLWDMAFAIIFHHCAMQRPDTVKIDAQDASGAKIKVKLSELSARVFQHEFDHLQGILFFDRMTMDVVESIHEQLKSLEDKYVEITGQASPETISNYRGTKDVVSFSR